MHDVPKLTMTGVTKRFGGVLALDAVDFELRSRRGHGAGR